MKRYPRAVFISKPGLKEFLETVATKLGFTPEDVIQIDEDMPSFVFHFVDGSSKSLIVYEQPRTEGATLHEVVASFMQEIGKTLSDVKDVVVELPYVHILLKNDERITIEVAAPGELFPTKH